MRITFDDSTPDSLGRRHYWLFWVANYHPGDPAGEYHTAERGQIFFGVPPKTVNAAVSEG